MKNLLLPILFTFLALPLGAQKIKLNKSKVHTNQVLRMDYSSGRYDQLKVQIESYLKGQRIIVEDMNIYRRGASNIQFSRPGDYYIGVYDSSGNHITGKWVKVDGRSNEKKPWIIVKKAQNE